MNKYAKKHGRLADFGVMLLAIVGIIFALTYLAWEAYPFPCAIVLGLLFIRKLYKEHKAKQTVYCKCKERSGVYITNGDTHCHKCNNKLLTYSDLDK